FKKLDGETTIFKALQKLNYYECRDSVMGRAFIKFTDPMMKFIPWLSLLVIGCSVSKNPLRKEVKALQKGIIKDDSSYVYALPYENNKSHLLIQGYFSHFSHKERAALDFKMKRGTKILAARDGVVVRVKEDGDKGGLNKKYRPY